MNVAKNMTNKTTLTNIIPIFIISSFIGWLYETIITSIQCGQFADRGFLHLPLCPIYGFGALVILLLFSRIKNGFAVFCAGTLVTTIVELIASYLLEHFLHIRLWSYAGWPLQFEERVSLLSSLLFGILSVLLVKIIYPATRKYMQKLSAKKQIVLCVSSIGIIMIDTILSLNKFI